MPTETTLIKTLLLGAALTLAACGTADEADLDGLPVGDVLMIR